MEKLENESKITSLTWQARIKDEVMNATLSEYLQNGPEPVMMWDIPQIRIFFIVIYSIVFFTCLIGNLTVILVVTLHWRMRSVTNFCLANLAVADLCVAIFCIYQSLYLHLSTTWNLGVWICKIYHFINEMSLTASVLILVVICIERYLAIIHPMRCKSWLTLNRLRSTILGVWGISAIYSLPRLYYTTVISHGFLTAEGEDEHICTPNRNLYNSKLFDGIHMTLLFLFPLLVITILYTIIGIALWKSSRTQTSSSSNTDPSSSSGGVAVEVNGSTLSKRSKLSCLQIICCSGGLSCFKTQNSTTLTQLTDQVSLDNIEESENEVQIQPVFKLRRLRVIRGGKYGVRALEARRKIIKMLIVIVCTFSVCNLPFHARKIWQNWSASYDGSSLFSTLFTQATLLIRYANSGINPLLYAFMSKKFRQSLSDLIGCRIRRSLRVARHASIRSTNLIPINTSVA